MSKRVELSRRGGELLLGLLERTRPIIAASVTQDLPAELSSELVGIGALEKHGASRATVVLGDNDGPAFRDLAWQADQNTYGYFDASDGNVAIAHESRALYSIALPWWLSWLANSLELTNSGQPAELIPNLAWDLGDLWVARQRKVPLLFVRQLHRESTFRALREALQKRAGRNGGLILTSSQNPVERDLAEPAFIVAPIADGLTNDPHSFAIDRALVLSPYTAMSSRVLSIRPLNLSPDGRRLTINGSITIHFKSNIHVKLIRRLAAGHKEGKRWRARELLDDAGSSVTTLARAFGGEKWKQLKPYLRSKYGLWGFDL